MQVSDPFPLFMFVKSSSDRFSFPHSLHISHTGVSLWGDNADVPTAIILSAKSAKPIFTYTTPGSMFGLDIVHDIGASTPANDVLYFAVAGKHTPANVMGNGGDAYAWRVDVPV